MQDDGSNYKLLVKGNTLAKQWARKIMGRRKLGRFLKCILTPHRMKALNIPQNQQEAILAIPIEDRQAILATQEVVADIFTKYDKLALRIARKLASGVGRDQDADVTQFESEARVGLLKAIRGYSDPDVKFVTYAYRAIFNEVSRYIARSTGVGLSGSPTALLVRYKRKVEELTKASLPHSFEDVCSALSLKSGQITRLRAALATIASENELEESAGNALAEILLDARKDSSVDLELIRRLEATALTSLEKFAWISQSPDIRALFPDAFPSLKDVAAHFEVTPQAASEALKRARRKLAASLGDDWNPAA